MLYDGFAHYVGQMGTMDRGFLGRGWKEGNITGMIIIMLSSDYFGYSLRNYHELLTFWDQFRVSNCMQRLKEMVMVFSHIKFHDTRAICFTV